MNGTTTTATRLVVLACALGTAFGSTRASAKPLTSVWMLEPKGQSGKMTTAFGKFFLEQRLIPAQLVQVTATGEWMPGKPLARDTYLFKVFQDDGATAYCTFKDQSAGNIAKSLFIPVLDRRPCFIDTDSDGRFDKVFTVFDKYKSALTPSGDIPSAKPMASPIPYLRVDSTASPKKYVLRLQLEGSHDPEKTRIGVWFSLGDGPGQPMLASFKREGRKVTTVNTVVEIVSVVGNEAQIDLTIRANELLLGESGGAFYGGKTSDLPANWER